MKTTAELTALRDLAETTAALRAPVTIVDDYGHVDKDVVLVGKKEPVTWTNHTKHAVTIFFDHGSPFKRKEPIVVAPGDTESSDEPTNFGRHKYTVIGYLGNTDPTVIIDG